MSIYGAPVSALPAKVVRHVTSDRSFQTTTDRYIAVQRSEEFVRLRKTFRGFVFPMTAAFFLWYALYVLLSAYARDFMSIKLWGNINVALVLGLLQFVTTFLIAWIYARWAERRLDPVADKLKAEIEEGSDAG